MTSSAVFKQKLKNLFKGKRKFPQRLLLALLPCLALSFTLCFFGPLDLVCLNSGFVAYSALDLIPYTAAVMGAVLAGLLLVASVPGGKVHAFIVSTITGMAAAVYLQGAFLNPDFGTLDGHTINWQSFSRPMLVNLAVWFVILLIPHLIHYFSIRFWKRFVMVISLALILMQGVSLGIKLAEQRQPEQAVQRNSRYLSDAEMLKVGSGQNIVVFLLDSTSSRDLDEMLEKYPEALQLLHDFTRFTNANSHYMFTVPALVNLLTGQVWDQENIPIAEFMDASWKSETASGFYSALSDKGYERNFYMLLPEAAHDPAVLEGTFSNLKITGKDFSLDKSAFVSLYKLSLYRYVPITMKPFFVIYSTDIVNVLTHPDTMTNEWDFVEQMNSGSLQTGGSANKFIFYYLAGTHRPFRLDDRGRLISSDLAPEYNTNYSESEDQTAGFFYLIADYIRQLKEMGLYDETGIIVLADHGNNANALSDHQPIYMVKMPGDYHDSVVEDPTPITTQDCFLADVMAMTGETARNWGIPSLETEAGPETERWTVTYAKDPDLPKLPGAQYNVFHEYRYTGDGSTLIEKWQSGDHTVLPLKDSFY